jgi:NAD-dependent deacetylase
LPSSRSLEASPVLNPTARLAALFAEARRPVVFTGAGVSTASGIPDFRSPGGMWARYAAGDIDYPSFIGGPAGRRKYWALSRELYPLIRAARPSAAHRALVQLYRMGRLDCCITQNVDDLHQRAGLPEARVIELHGNATRARCLSCGARYSRDEVHDWLQASGADVPDCPSCGGIIKPTTVLFGEPMPRDATEEAERRARQSDLFVVVGSSLVVYPAAYMPAHAKQAGARLAVVNLTRTPYDGQADVVVPGEAGETLSAVVDAMVSSRSS